MITDTPLPRGAGAHRRFPESATGCRSGGVSFGSALGLEGPAETNRLE